MNSAIHPGTFDPITFGHLDLIERALKIFDHLIVAVGQNPQKSPIFTVEERVDMITRAVADLPSVRVEGFTGLVTDFIPSDAEFAAADRAGNVYGAQVPGQTLVKYESIR